MTLPVLASHVPLTHADPAVWRTREMMYVSHERAAVRSVQAPRRAALRQDGTRKEEHMPHTSHDFLDEARRALPEVNVESVAARRTRGDEVVLLDVREHEEVRATS